MGEIEAGITEGPLEPEALGGDPMEACSRWLDDAYERSGVAFPNAVSLSTVDESGWPQARIVLVRGVDARGVVFFTNYHSAKARALRRTPRAAVAFYWPDLNRQIRLRGPVERVSSEESDDYFRTRPRGSQIGAWASDQSEVLESREVLERRYREIEARFAGTEVPRPDHWGGFVLMPNEIEFWQGREERLHDRLRFRRAGSPEKPSWTVERLNP